MEFKRKDFYTLEDMLQIMEMLRDPVNGCEWDRVQTHLSVRKDFIEETYEVVEAIDNEDSELLREENLPTFEKYLNTLCSKVKVEKEVVLELGANMLQLAGKGNNIEKNKLKLLENLIPDFKNCSTQKHNTYKWYILVPKTEITDDNLFEQMGKKINEIDEAIEMSEFFIKKYFDR